MTISPFQPQNLEFFAEIYIDSLQNLQFETLSESHVGNNHKTNAFFRLDGVFSIYFESIQSLTYLRIVQEGFNSLQKPVLYDIVRYKIPLKTWFKINLTIQSDGSYEVQILN